MKEEVTITIGFPEGCFFRNFLMGAVEQMKEQCSLKEAEDAGVLFAFRVLDNIIQQLPTEDSDDNK
jgi:hypothetical protein